MIRLASEADAVMAQMGLRQHVNSPCMRCGLKAERKLGFFTGPWVRGEDGDGPGWAPLCDLSPDHWHKRHHPSGGAS